MICSRERRPYRVFATSDDGWIHRVSPGVTRLLVGTNKHLGSLLHYPEVPLNLQDTLDQCKISAGTALPRRQEICSPPPEALEHSGLKMILRIRYIHGNGRLNRYDATIAAE